MSPSHPSSTCRRGSGRRLLAVVALVAAAVPALLAATSSPAAAAGSVSLSKSTGLDPAGETITVSGAGFDSSGTRGIYLMFCHQTGGRPTGSQCSGAQNWITHPQFGPPVVWSGSGAFSATIDVVGSWSGVDCTDGSTVCGVVTRNDHSDAHLFDQDSFTPVSFASVPEETTTTTSGPTSSVPSRTRPSISLDRSVDLAGGDVITVAGKGFEPDQGVYVRVCEEPTGTLGTSAGRARNCYPEQDGTHTVWVNPVGAGGTWTTPLTVTDSFGDVDCLTTACGVFVRRDHSGGATDFSQDAYVGITFTEGTTTPTTVPSNVARLTVTPSSDLVPGQRVTVTGEGFRPSERVFVGVCNLDVANFAACDFTNVAEVTVASATANAGAPGSFSTSLVVRSTFDATDCHQPDARCAVATWAVSGNDAAAEVSAALAFRPSGTGTGGTGTDSGIGSGGSTGTGGALARTGAESGRLALVGSLALLAGFGVLAVDRRRRAI